MTQDSFRAFLPFVKQIKGAKHSNYARFPHKEFMEFEKAVKVWRGEGLKKNEKTCPHCLLTLLKSICEDFEKYERSPKGKQILKSLEDGGQSEEEQSTEE